MDIHQIDLNTPKIDGVSDITGNEEFLNQTTSEQVSCSSAIKYDEVILSDINNALEQATEEDTIEELKIKKTEIEKRIEELKK